MKEQKNYAVVTTGEDKGVFAGFVENYNLKTGIATLSQARMVVYWSSDVHGIVGLAAMGPNAKCRITPPAGKIELTNVNSVMYCSDEARKQFEKGYWND
jgi:hypothetical protein